MTRIRDFLDQHTIAIHAAFAAYLGYLTATNAPATVSIPIIGILLLDTILIDAQYKYIDYLERKGDE